MGSRALEITIISGEGLRLSRSKRVEKNAFVTVSADQTQILASTRMDVDGGSYPTWNDKIFVDIPIQSRFLIVEVQCKSKYNGDRVVGGVRIPVKDFVGGFTPTNYLNFLSYRLRDRKGEKNGIINISIKVNSTKGDHVDGFNYSQPWLTASYNNQIAATTIVGNKDSNNGIVTGFPVW
ncbi:BON1-associated protein 2-like [Impatiens glandulifera]|uniref:BON1-associated protein 2-like n=1 Tax=Impatiens glandulifera TaxID=253017 RepID=UPI001FB04BCD|nr:BON1-associated protein 2-like [Impatiens glandulifera]